MPRKKIVKKKKKSHLVKLKKQRTRRAKCPTVLTKPKKKKKWESSELYHTQDKEKQQRNNCHVRRSYSSVIWLQLHFSHHSPIFSANWGDSILVSPMRKQSNLTNLPFSLLTNQTPTKTIFSPLFSLPFSIIPKISPTTQTFSVFKMMVNWESR